MRYEEYSEVDSERKILSFRAVSGTFFDNYFSDFLKIMEFNCR
jgi:hypothetical protein